MGPTGLERGPVRLQRGPVGLAPGPAGPQPGPSGLAGGASGLRRGPAGIQPGSSGLPRGPSGPDVGATRKNGRPHRESLRRTTGRQPALTLRQGRSGESLRGPRRSRRSGSEIVGARCRGRCFSPSSPKVYNGKHVLHPAIRFARTRRAEITIDRR
jgi:hypothetical protein